VNSSQQLAKLIRSSLLIGAGLVLPLGSAAAQEPVPDSLITARLAALGRLWSVAKFFHPAFLSRRIDWDSAVVAIIPRVMAARGTAEFAAAASDMLKVLGDPTTRVGTGARRSDSPSLPTRVAARWVTDSTLCSCRLSKTPPSIGSCVTSCPSYARHAAEPAGG
jgi:hypothetical protein